MRDDSPMKRGEKTRRSEEVRESQSRKPFDTSNLLVSLRKGAGRGWIVAERVGLSKYRVRCMTHGTLRDFTSSAPDAKAAVRLPTLWCKDCEQDADLFDTWIIRGDLKCRLSTQTDPWNEALAIVDVPDSHPAFLVAYEQLKKHVPEGSRIRLIEPRVLQLSGKKGRGLRTAKRFQAIVPLGDAQQGIVWIEAVAAAFGALLRPESHE